MKTLNTRKALKLIFIASLLILCLIKIYPINTKLTQLIEIFSFVTATISAVLIWYNLLAVKLISLLLYVAFVYFAFFPAKEYDKQLLAKNYVESLKQYNGVSYVWGGEGFTGIDCSGLIRKGLVNAYLKQGIITLNPGLVREAFKLWRNDTTAKALRDNYYNNSTTEVTKAESLNKLDYSTIRIGDMALNETGSHILAYTGDNKWIQADPLEGKVWEENPVSQNQWFNIPISVIRWKNLQ